MGSLRMLFYVVKCFTVNLENLAADAVWRSQLGRIDKQIQRNRRFVPITLGKTAHEVHQIGALHAQGPKISYNLAQLRTLVLNGLLEGRQPRNRLVGRIRNTAA